MRRAVLMLVMANLLVACQGNPAVTAIGPTPAQVVAAPADAYRGRTVSWGGEIVTVRNLRDRTLIEVLAYPLDAAQRPLLDSSPGGRFIVARQGFLEPREYAPGRALTALGRLDGTIVGTVGESTYRFPLVQAERLDLWPEASLQRDPKVHFGFGLSNQGGGVGIGVGF